MTEHVLLKVAAFQAPLDGCIYPTHHDARYPSSVTVHYPLHPLYGRGELPIRQRSGAGDAEQYLVEVEQGAQAIPVWMTDERRCAQMTTGFDPQCALGSYLSLLTLIRSSDL